jgi:hypothetical protein
MDGMTIGGLGGLNAWTGVSARGIGPLPFALSILGVMLPSRDLSRNSRIVDNPRKELFL